MGTNFFERFTLLRFFRLRSISFSSIFNVHAQSLLVLLVVASLGCVTGTESQFRGYVPQEQEKPQEQPLPQQHVQHEDIHLTGFLPPLYPNSRVMTIIKTGQDAEGHENGQNHILSQRDVSKHGHRTKRQVQNTYERFYLCMFTLFSNPNCRDGPQQSEASYEQGVDKSGGFGQFIPTSQPSNRNQNQGFFGQGFNGLFGGNFGLNPSPTPNFSNNYTPLFGQYYPQQQNQHFSPHHDYYQPQLPIIHQTPYPEQQVHRRPGPPPPTFVPLSIQNIVSSSSTRKTTPPSTTKSTSTSSTKFTTQRKPSTLSSTSGTTSIRTTPTTRRSSSTTTPKTLISTTRRSPPNRIKVENVLSTTFPVTGTTPGDPDCENGTENRVSTQKIKLTPTTPLPVSFSPLRPSSSTSRPSPSYPDFSSTVKTLAKENSALKSELEALREETGSFREQNKYLQDALSTLQSDSGKLKGRIAQLERTNDHLQQQNGQLQHSMGDMRTQVNEMRGKVRYAEEKLVRLSRQSIEDQKLTTRLQNRVRDLNKENNECKSELYQLQERRNPGIGGISEGSGSNKVEQGPQPIYRDDASTTAPKEQDPVNRGPLEVLEFDYNKDGESSERTTVLPGSLLDEGEVTTILPNSDDGVTSSGLVLEDEPATTVSPEVVTSTPAASTTTQSLPVTTPSTPAPTTKLTTTSTPKPDGEDSSPEFFNFPSMSSESFAQHPGIIFDDESFGPGRIIGQDEDDDSNELSILLGHPDEDPNRSLGGYAPANFDAFSSFSPSQRPNPNPNLSGGFNHPFNNYWPYHQYSTGVVGGGGGGHLNSQGENEFYTKVSRK